ncbi:MAG: hypothetical protein ACLPUT_08460 [Solirubrobacteraceae bacterium]
MLATALGELPALPLHTAGRYVAGAYVVLFALVLIYVAIMAIRLSRIERELGELLSMSEHSAEPATSAAEPSDGHMQDPQRESTLA